MPFWLSLYLTFLPEQSITGVPKTTWIKKNQGSTPTNTKFERSTYISLIKTHRKVLVCSTEIWALATSSDRLEQVHKIGQITFKWRQSLFPKSFPMTYVRCWVAKMSICKLSEDVASAHSGFNRHFWDFCRFCATIINNLFNLWQLVQWNPDN